MLFGMGLAPFSVCTEFAYMVVQCACFWPVAGRDLGGILSVSGSIWRFSLFGDLNACSGWSSPGVVSAPLGPASRPGGRVAGGGGGADRASPAPLRPSPEVGGGGKGGGGERVAAVFQDLAAPVSRVPSSCL